MLAKRQIIRDEKHRRWVTTLSCVCCGRQDGLQACHIRSGNGAGMGLKSGDDNVLPCCFQCHTKQHAMGSEAKFWEQYGGLDKANQLATALYAFSGDTESAWQIINGLRA